MTEAHSADSQIATAPRGDPVVRHYSELLLLPFRVVAAMPPYEVQALPMQGIANQLAAGGQGPTQPWQALPACTVKVACPPGSEPLAAELDAAAWQHHQALSYFHPTVRSFLFGSRAIADASKTNVANDYMRCFRRTDLKQVTVKVWNGDAKSQEQRAFSVVRCDLALFQPDVGVLQLELQAEMNDGGGWPLSAVQRVRDELRRLFPPYLSDWPPERGWHAGHCPMAVGWTCADGSRQDRSLAGLSELDRLLAVERNSAQIAGLPLDAEKLPVFDHWAVWLGLDGFLKENGWKWLPPEDDRLPSLAFLALDNPRALSRGDWVRLGLADAPGSDVLPYARSSLSKFEERFCYDRFWHEAGDSTDSPSRIMNCGYAFTMVGAFSDKGFFMNPLNGAWVTFRQIYARMGLVAHFQKVALLGALARLSALAWRGPNGQLVCYDHPETHDRLERFYAEFLEFTQVYWFEEVSPQAQGVDLFEQWQRELRSKELYAEVRQELKDLVEYMNARAAQRQAEATERFTRVAAWLGGIGVVAGLLGMNLLPESAQLGTNPLNDWATSVAGWFGLPRVPWLDAMSLALFAALFALVTGVAAFAGLPRKSWRRVWRWCRSRP